ncbi:MAG: 6-bladed beta-propeller [Bacteroidota bacterium]
MKKLKTVLILTALLAVASCEKSKTGTPKVDLANVEAKTTSLSDYFEVKKSICLDVNNRNYISKVDKILKTKKHYLLLNKFDQNSLYLFNHAGEFIKQLKFSDLEQYNVNQFYDVLHDKNSNQIELLTDTGIVFLAAEDLSYINKQQLRLSATRFSKSEDFYHFITPEESGLTIIDAEFDSSNKITYFPENNTTPFYQMTGINSFSTFNDKTRYFRNFDNSIYDIEKGKVSPKWAIDFNETKFTEAEKKEIKNPKEVYEIQNKSFLHKFYFETKKLMYLSFFNNKDFTICLVNKNNDEKTCFDVVDSDNDITNEPYFPFIMNTTSEGNFLAVKNLESENSGDCDSDFMIYELKFNN